jgi:predicted transcriptional regulator
VNGKNPPEAGRVTLRLSDRYRQITDDLKWKLADHAKAAGIHQSNMFRVLAGEQFPSRNAIAGIVRTCREEFPDVDPLSLFEVVPDEPSELLRRAA